MKVIPSPPKNNQVKIKGILIAKDWDENGRIISVQIASHEEENYALDIKEIKVQELLDHLHEEIEVIGELIANGKGSYKINVKKYKLFGKEDLKNIKRKVNISISV